jgi:hypothetical protein
MPVLFQLLVIVIIFGLIFWCISFLPIPAPFNIIVQVICVLIAIIFLLDLLGVVPMGLGLGAHRIT